MGEPLSLGIVASPGDPLCMLWEDLGKTGSQDCRFINVQSSWTWTLALIVTFCTPLPSPRQYSLGVKANSVPQLFIALVHTCWWEAARDISWKSPKID